MSHGSRGTLILFSVLCFFGLSAAAAWGQAPAEIPKQDYYGTWKMFHDGWAGTLILKASGTAKVLDGEYKAADGRIHAVAGTAEGYKITFQIDFNDSKTFTSQDQSFSGYLFTQGRSGMAGTTAWSGIPYGWYASKESKATSFPVTVSDYPDPEGPVPVTATVTSSSGRFEVRAGKEEYAKGETVEFTMSNELKRTVDLAGIVYVIKYKDGNAWKEFYTSQRDFLADLSMNDGKKRNWGWGQWDNELLNKAKPGTWRLKLFVPGVRPEPFFVEFTIKN